MGSIDALLLLVIPAKAGTQFFVSGEFVESWIPALNSRSAVRSNAGMTVG
jgi:hypothetical protein